MSIRIRVVDGVTVALCAARSMPKEGDVYLDDAAHMALAQKFWIDYPEVGIAVDPDVEATIEREESNNPNRIEWDRMYRTVQIFNALKPAPTDGGGADG